MIKGYKVFNSDWTCIGFQYQVGQTYTHDGDIGMCSSGFHFCRIAADCFNYYSFDPMNKVAEVEAIGDVESSGDKSVTNKIAILREISWIELLDIVNTGKGCSGHSNSGDQNSGNWNSGDWNSGDWNSGFLNNATPAVMMFNKPTFLSFTEARELKAIQAMNSTYKNNIWIDPSHMTDEEKREHPEYETTGGYLKVLPFKEACKLMWENMDADQRQSVLELPNFDTDVYYDITGIDVRKM